MNELEIGFLTFGMLLIFIGLPVYFICRTQPLDRRKYSIITNL